MKSRQNLQWWSIWEPRSFVRLPAKNIWISHWIAFTKRWYRTLLRTLGLSGRRCEFFQCMIDVRRRTAMHTILYSALSATGAAIDSDARLNSSFNLIHRWLTDAVSCYTSVYPHVWVYVSVSVTSLQHGGLIHPPLLLLLLLQLKVKGKVRDSWPEALYDLRGEKWQLIRIS